MKKDLYIIGAGSVGGHVAYNIAAYSGQYAIKGFFDDDPKKIGSQCLGYPVLGSVKEVLDLKEKDIAIGIAFPKTKEKIIKLLEENSSLRYPTLVHERSWLSENVKLGKGTIIYPGTSINYGSEVGDFVVMNMNCAIGHHSVVGSYSSFAPGVNTGGHTKIMNGVDMGIGVSTLQGVTIGENSVIGGQALVNKDIPEKCTAVGVPAKPIKFHE